MKRILLTSLASFVLACAAQADVFDQNEILDRMKKAADWQLSHPFGFDDLKWHCAPFYMGLSDLSEISGDRKYIDAAKAMGTRNEWNLGERTYFGDDQAVGQVYLKLYQLDKDPAMIRKLRDQFDWILANPPKQEYLIMRTRNRRGAGMWYTIERWGWCDALYMAPPIWTGLWNLTGEEKYLNYMVQEWKQTTEWLWDADESLYYRDRSFVGVPTPSGKKNFWARGNGWVLAGLAEVMQYLPKERPEYLYFENTFKVMAAKIKSIQKENGLWAMSLIDPEFCPQDETTGAAFFTYGLAWGINNGLLNRAEYEPVVRKGWKALCERQQENGRLINVQPEGDRAGEFNPDSTVIYGMGAFISAGSEVYKLVSGGQK
jgi:unsaturated rhamnogalacturonyl hydrolase